MVDRNPYYFSDDSRSHPLVRGQYAICTAPILEMFDEICLWIDNHAPGGYIYGYSRFGKTWASRFWIPKLLKEQYGKKLTFFRYEHKQHDRFSEILFLSELLGASRHKYGRAISKKIMLDRIARLYATTARNHGSNRIVLLIDEAQDMHDPEFQTLCNLENELDQHSYKLTVISVGSQELTYQHSAFIQAGQIHLMARYMVRSSRFRGICNAEELKNVLIGYDSFTEWPEKSGKSFTKYFFPKAYEDGFRMANHANNMWRIFEELGPRKSKYSLEVPMEHIAMSVEYIFRNLTDEYVCADELKVADLDKAINDSNYQGHMSAISHAPNSDRRPAS